MKLNLGKKRRIQSLTSSVDRTGGLERRRSVDGQDGACRMESLLNLTSGTVTGDINFHLPFGQVMLLAPL